MAATQEAVDFNQLPSSSDRGGRLPVGRLPLMAFVSDAETETAIHEALWQLALTNVQVVRGGITKAIQHLTTERSPKILIVDLSGVDQPVARVQELAEVCEPGITVIGIGSQNDIGLYRELIQSGLAEYLVKPVTAALLSPVLSGKAGMGEAIPVGRKLGTVIACIGARGGVGATTLAANLAWYIADRQHRRVSLLDLDLQHGSCALALDVKPTPGLREALTNPLRVDQLFLERAAALRGERLSVLSSEEPLQEELQFSPDAVQTLISTLRAQAHWVVVDIPRIATAPYRRALERADVRIIVADQTLHSARDAVRLQASLGNGGHRNLIIVNRSGEGGGHAVSLREMRDVLGAAPAAVMAYDPRTFAKAVNAGRLAAQRHGQFAKAVAGLALAISGPVSGGGKWWRFGR